MGPVMQGCCYFQVVVDHQTQLAHLRGIGVYYTENSHGGSEGWEAGSSSSHEGRKMRASSLDRQASRR